MGCYPSNSLSNISSPKDKLFAYPRKCKIPVKIKGSSGNLLSTQNISFMVTEPVTISSKEIEFNNQKLVLSSCLLPGFDPRGEYDKKCQDNCFYLYDSNSILCCLFDGHGSEGEKVAYFCEQVIEKYYSLHSQFLKVT